MNVVQVKKLFFTSKTVKDRLDPASRKALSKFGAFVRRTAKNSLKYGKGSSKPGMPPMVHRTQSRKKTNKKGITKVQSVSPLRELIFFAYDPTNKSVVIGPMLGGSRSGAPKSLEKGGHARVNGRTVFVRPRPTMKPAFDQELTKIGGILKNILK